MAIEFTFLPWSGGSHGEERKLFLDEINVMKRISDSSNPHVLKMLGCVTTTLPMMLIMQFVPHGSLKEYLRAMKSNVDSVTNKVAIYIHCPIQLPLPRMYRHTPHNISPLPVE